MLFTALSPEFLLYGLVTACDHHVSGRERLRVALMGRRHHRASRCSGPGFLFFSPLLRRSYEPFINAWVNGEQERAGGYHLVGVRRAVAAVRCHETVRPVGCVPEPKERMGEVTVLSRGFKAPSDQVLLW